MEIDLKLISLETRHRLGYLSGTAARWRIARSPSWSPLDYNRFCNTLPKADRLMTMRLPIAAHIFNPILLFSKIQRSFNSSATPVSLRKLAICGAHCAFCCNRNFVGFISHQVFMWSVDRPTSMLNQFPLSCWFSGTYFSHPRNDHTSTNRNELPVND